MSRYRLLFLDTEFTCLEQGASLISLALVAESGEEFYAEFTDYELKDRHSWVKEHVIPKLFLGNAKKQSNSLAKLYIRGNNMEIRSALRIWLAQFGQEKASLQVWADCPAYDWVFFCELFGGAREIPPVIHYMCMDLATWFLFRGENPDRNRVDYVKDIMNFEGEAHNALFDAKIIRACHQKLTG